MNLLAVVLAQLLLLLGGPGADGLLDVAGGVLAADHETNLTGWVGWNGGVGVLDVGEDLLAVLLELGDQWEVKPLVFSYIENESQHANKIKNRACPKEIRADVERRLVRGVQ